ncbi:MAG: ATP-binding protein [Gammaproteobacteria bacterium]|nr:ATP-binding protein [Gammaproteobacteria bacterium]
MKLPRTSIRLKIIATVLPAISVILGVISYTMAGLFHEDKSTYIRDIAAVTAQNVGSEAKSILEAYQDRLQVFSQVIYQSGINQSNKLILLKDLFQSSKDLLSITIYEDGVELASVMDSDRLTAAQIDLAALESERSQRLPLPGVLRSGESLLLNSSLSAALPTLTLYFKPVLIANKSDVQIAAIIDLKRLQQLSTRSQVMDTFIIDHNMNILVHKDMKKVVKRERFSVMPEVTSFLENPISSTSMEYTIDGNALVAGYSKIDGFKLMAIGQIPASLAYLGARELLIDLAYVALGLLIVFSILGVIWARLISKPIVELSEATKEVAKGKFNIRVEHRSRDEIGMLATSFNTMNDELAKRESELKKTQDALVQSEKMSAFGQISAGIAHEVKNPLASILGFAQLIRKKIEPENTRFIEKVDIIISETKRCTDIVTNLMRFSRKETVEHTPQDINDVIEKSVTIVSHQLGQLGVKLHLDLKTGLPKLNGNSNQLQQVMLNFAINAAQAMKESEEKIFSIETGLDKQGNIFVVVSDTGPGVPQEFRSKLFEPFFTTKPAGEGTGLGLSVSYGIIKDHGGEISLIDVEGRGAVFKIVFPVLQGMPSQRELHEQAS